MINTMKSIAIIGTGNVGSALARVCARRGVGALLANTRGPESFSELATEVAPNVRATTLDEARQADILILAMPFLETAKFGASQSRWDGQTIVDTTNAFLLPNSEEILRGRLSTHVVAEAFPGADVVKAFNQLPANVLGRELPPRSGKIVVFVASDSAPASTEVAAVAERLGYSPVELGRIDEGGRLIQARNSLVLRLFVEQPMF
jgi:8-hydroxy-5-deazaflavin:NADPH oxidoreductase